MVHYKLTYFNLRGRAELSRLILHHAGVPFEDFRFEMNEWPQYKSKMPFGQVPILEVDGQVLTQSITIARYLARQHGLAGKDGWENAQADMYVDCYADLANGMKPFLFEKDEEKKKEMFMKYHQDSIKPLIEKIEQHLMKNNTGFLVGKSTTWADLAFYSYFAPMIENYGDFIIPSTAPHMRNLITNVGNIPQIKKYVESRPKTHL